MEQYLQERGVENTLNLDGMPLTKWKSLSTEKLEDNPSGGLDCNICLDCVQDPVVTFCGHLYCWPCIYKWIHFQSTPSENCNLQQPQCPVCKAELSEESVIPLYGRGLTMKSSEAKTGQLGIVIPQRPPSPKCGSVLPSPTTPNISRAVPQLQQPSYAQQPQLLHQYSNPSSQMASPTTFSLSGTMGPNMSHPVVRMLGEMVLTRMFGNSQTALYSYPNSYLSGGSSLRMSPRMRRQMMQADNSLSRIWLFLCWCMILCLLLF